MKERNLAITAFLVLVLVATCQPVLAANSVTVSGRILSVPAPVAAFSGSPLTGTVPLTVMFDSRASAGTITGYAWDFDNDGTVDSTAANPHYTYAAAGIYTVKLTVTGPGGSDEEIKTGYITVSKRFQRPVARFTQDKYAGKAPLTVAFHDRSFFSPTAYLWSFGDGSTSPLKDPVHTYTSAGIYHVRYRVSNDAGSDSTQGVVVVLPKRWWW